MPDADNAAEFVMSERRCEHCDGEIWTAPKADGTARKKRFCSTTCGHVHRNVSGKTREQIKAEYKQRKTFTCQHCGEQYVNKRTRNDGEGEKFCGHACYVLNLRSNAKEQPAKFTKIYTCDCEICGSMFLSKTDRATCSSECLKERQRRSATASYYKKYRFANTHRECAHCGIAFCSLPGVGIRVCPPCSEQKAKADKRERRSRYNHTRRARLRGCAAEPFSIESVFTRDKWMCQICGGDTPQHLRGTMHDDAPELDHITPLASGGSHTYINTQCLCRTCNILKGASSNDEFKQWNQGVARGG